MVRPHFNSHSRIPIHQIQTNNNGTSAPPPQQQGNSMLNSAQFHPQMGIINNPPQIATAPFNNYNNIHPNGSLFFTNAPNGPSPSSSSCLMNNGSNGQFPLQNGVLSSMAPSQPSGAHCHPAQFLNGFGPQNISSMPMNRISTSQPNPQLFAHNNNSINMMTPYFNQNVGFPIGQVFVQGPMQNPMQNQMQNPVQNQIQNMGQFFQMQVPNYTQVVQGNMPVFQSQVSQGMAHQNGSFMMKPSQVSQGIGPQGSTFVMKSPFGLGNSNDVVPHGNQEQHRLIPPVAEVNGPNAPQQLQGNSFHSVQLQQTQNFGSNIKSQGNPGKENGVNIPNTNWRNAQNRNFTSHTKSDASHKGLMNSQFNHTQNANGKFKFHNERGGKAHTNGARKSGLAASSNQTQVEKKRSLPLNYTEQEIQQWREERKKNYPSKDNVEKKLTKREVADTEAKLRRQQLKEILAKQAELGCEVAEIPSHYLLDSAKQVDDGREDNNKRAFGKKGRQQNKFNKRGRFNKNDWFTKKQGPTDHDSSKANNDQNGCSNKKQRLGNGNLSGMDCKREPTLLQKLLDTDIRRDKAHLLQVFRFMVMNSYLKDWPKKPLNFPNVVVKEAEGCLVEEKVVAEGSGKIVIEEVKGDDVTEPRVSEETGGFSSSNIIGEEEGEIID